MPQIQAQTPSVHTLDFESLNVGSGGVINGSTLNGAPSIGIDGFQFSNQYQDMGGWISWEGFAISNHANRTDRTFNNQYSSYVTEPEGGLNLSGGANGSSNFAVGYMDGRHLGLNTSSHTELRLLPTIDLAMGTQIQSLQLTNTTYAASTILYGDDFTSAFRPGDIFELSIFGVDADNTVLDPVTFRLADYVSSSGAQDGFVLSQWEKIDLQQLEDAKSLHFMVTTTNEDIWGPTTPLYFAIDNLTYTVAAVPEPSSIALCSLILVGGYAARRRSENRAIKSA